MIYFIADTHFSDDAIRRYENRPYGDVRKMNESMIENWNSVVADEDEVYVLGDFGALSDSKEECDGLGTKEISRNILAALKGTKYLVKGNHDTESNEYYRQAGFAEVYDKPVILEEFWILSHEPLYVCENMPYANLFGHVHNSPLYKDYSRQHYCVSVERIGYQPISFAEVAACVKSGKGNMLGEHHEN